jgi:hypothetical protein
MTDEPIRPIEEQLLRSAHQRRSQATDPFELHPATRHLLHAEVSRTYKPSAGTKTSRRPWSSLFWTRFALVTTATAAAVFFTILVVRDQPNPPRFQLARVDEAAPAPEIYSRDTLTPPAPASSASSASRAVEFGADRSLPELAKTSPESAELSEVREFKASALPSEAQRPPRPSSTPARSENDPPAPTHTSNLATAMQSIPADESQPSDAATWERFPSSPSLSLEFAQVQRERVNLQSPPVSEVLRSFQFLQHNESVRIVDADGSIYEGTLQEGASPTHTRFVATGTNRTTQNRVIFQGALHQNLAAVPGAPGAATLGVTTTTSTTDAGSTAQRFSAVPRDQSRSSIPPIQIIGQATLNDHTRFEIRAVQTDTP